MATEANVLAAIEPIIYQIYMPGFQDYTQKGDILSSLVKANEKVENVGNNWTIKVQRTLSEGISMSGGVTSALPDSGQVENAEYKGTPGTMRATIRIWREILDWTKATKDAAISHMDQEMRGVEKATKCEIERMTVGDAGVTPIACVASATVENETDTWVTVTIDNGGAAVNALCGTQWPVRYFRAGEFIDILAANHASVSSTATESLQILAITGANKIKIKCATNAAADTLAALLADGQLIYHQNGYNTEFEGIMSMFGKTTNQLFRNANADRAVTTNEYLIPFVQRVNASGILEEGAPTGTPKEWSILNLVQFIEHLKNVNQAELDQLTGLWDSNVQNRYIQMKQNQNNYIPESTAIQGWPYKAIMCEDVKFTCPPSMFTNAISIVPFKLITKYLVREMAFVNDFGGGMFQRVPGYDAADAYMVGSWQYGCQNFQWGGTLYDLKGAYDA